MTSAFILPKFSARFFETLTDVANALVNSEFPVLSYGAISEIPSTGPGPPHNPESLTHIDCYMDDVISVVQGAQIANTDSLMEKSVPSSGSSYPYWESSKTR